MGADAAFTAERKATHDEHYLTVYGRLKRGITIDGPTPI